MGLVRGGSRPVPRLAGKRTGYRGSLVRERTGRGGRRALRSPDSISIIALATRFPSERAYAIIRELGTYAEYSPGDGIRLLCWVPAGTRSIKREAEGYEFYASKRWLSITGRHSFSAPRTLATIDAETPKRLYGRWSGAAVPDAGDATPERRRNANRERRGNRSRNRRPGPSARKFEDAGVPVEQMARVARRALKLLAGSRASEYGSWVNVLCALRWVYEQTEDELLLKAWHKFSRRCSRQVRRGGRTTPMGSLRGSAGGRAIDDRLAPALGERGLRDAGRGDHRPEEGETEDHVKRGSLDDGTLPIGSAIEAEPVKWLWKGRIPEAKLTIIAGDAGDGKSFLDYRPGGAGLDRPRLAGRIPLSSRPGSPRQHGGRSRPIRSVLASSRRERTAIRMKIYLGMLNDGDRRARSGSTSSAMFPRSRSSSSSFPDIRLVIIDPL